MNQAMFMPCQVIRQSSTSEGGETREEICKALSLFAGCARAVNDLPDSAVALSTLFSEVWPHIKAIL